MEGNTSESSPTEKGPPGNIPTLPIVKTESETMDTVMITMDTSMMNETVIIEDDDTMSADSDPQALSENTIKVTKMAVKTLREYYKDRTGKTEFEELSVSDLNNLLADFFTNMKRKDGTVYSLSSLKAMRAGIQRYLQSVKNINTIHDSDFDFANSKFHEKCQYLIESGLGTGRKAPFMSVNDLKKLYNSSCLDERTPSGLQNKVFVDLMLFSHLNPGRNELSTMTKDMMEFGKDTNGRDYVCIAGGPVGTPENVSKATLFSVPGCPKCPVQTFKKYVSKLHPACLQFWQRPLRPEGDLESMYIWYQPLLLGIRKLSNFMIALSQDADLSQVYTNKSIQSTLSDMRSSETSDTALMMEVLRNILPKQAASPGILVHVPVKRPRIDQGTDIVADAALSASSARPVHSHVVAQTRSHPGGQIHAHTGGQTHVHTGGQTATHVRPANINVSASGPPQSMAGRVVPVSGRSNVSDMGPPGRGHVTQPIVLSDDVWPTRVQFPIQRHRALQSGQQERTSPNVNMSSKSPQINSQVHVHPEQIMMTNRGVHTNDPKLVNVNLGSPKAHNANLASPKSISASLGSPKSVNTNLSSPTTIVLDSTPMQYPLTSPGIAKPGVCNWVVNPNDNAIRPLQTDDGTRNRKHVEKDCQTDKVTQADKSVQVALTLKEEPTNQNTDVEGHDPLNKHHPKVTNRCNACGINFDSAMVFAMHRTLHGGEGPFQCSVCNKFFNNTVEFNGHIYSSHQ